MSDSQDAAHLLDIAQAAQLILQFSDETDAAGFKTNALVQSAVLHQFLVLGEATKRLSAEFRAAHPSIPWPSMARMRDRLIHGYDSIKLETVWKTATSDIPLLLEQLAPLLPPEPPA